VAEQAQQAERNARLAWTAEFARSLTTLSARGAAWRLAALAVVSLAVRAALGSVVHGPFVFLDELGYQRMAYSLAHTGRFDLFGKAGLSYSPLYSVVLAPVYAFVHSAQPAYAWSKVVNAGLMSLAVLPVYGIARAVLPRRPSVGVAALSLVAPLMVYSALGLSENLAYPLFLVAAWAMLRTVREPSPWNDVLLLAAIVLACAARLQQVALVPAALTAIVLVAVIRPEGRLSRLRSLAAAFWAHRLLLVTIVVVGAAALVRAVANGGQLPLAGRYAGVGSAHASALREAEIAFQHLAELVFAVGVLPFMGALVAGLALVRSRFPRKALVFASVAVATTAWLVLEVGVDAAEYDETSAHARPVGTQGFVDLPRIHERYLIYLVPFFLVAFVAALRVPLSRIGLRAYVLLAAVTALLPAAIPFGRDINGTVIQDTFGLALFTAGVKARAVPVGHATLAAVLVAAAFLLGYLYAVARDRRAIAVAVLVFVSAVTSALVQLRVAHSGSYWPSRGTPAHHDWVDRAVSGGVVLVGGSRSQGNALRQTAFYNFTVTRLYYTCARAFGPDFGEEQVSADGAGRLRSESGSVVQARYAVVPASFDVPGRVLARDPKGRLVLVAPEDGVLSVPAANRGVVDCVR
jgi:hypothetical protein